ncbi:MAG: rhodanese-like domain-containing protein [Desulfobacter sp.]|nr:MAG: rhodanese-like domain-containing protein [Desulfobacter sp.]
MIRTGRWNAAMNMKDIRGCLSIMLAAFFLGFGINTFSPAGIPLVGQWDKTAGVIMAGSNSDDAVHAREINNPLKVKRMIDSGLVVLVDVRRPDMYSQGHLPGALSYPLSEYDQIIGRFLETVEKDAPLLLYCAGVTCRDSHTFGARLMKLGYTDVSVYAGGYSEWQEMEFELE